MIKKVFDEPTELLFQVIFKIYPLYNLEIRTSN